MDAHASSVRTIIAALVASPMVWPHYLALLFVPIALVSPTLSWLWLTPLLAYPVAQTTGRPWVIPLYLAIVAAPLVRLWPWPARVRTGVSSLELTLSIDDPPIKTAL